MLKNKPLLLLPFILAGCTMSDNDMRKAYSNHYQQSADYVAVYKEKIAGMDSAALAKYAAAEEQKKMRGQSSVKIDDYITAQNIQARGQRVVFDYSLSKKWLALPPRTTTRKTEANGKRFDIPYLFTGDGKTGAGKRTGRRA
ncbi:hypothetical protein PYX06_10710 [Citrobacter amalonaticus]|nr:hypothetical protein [Citrobacter amalonaticus]